MKPTYLALALLFSWAPLAPAPRPVQESAPAPKKIESLAWLAGHWRVEMGAVSTEELWLPPRGGMMLGVSRTVGGGRTEFEYLRIEEDANGLVYLASPGGRKATPFRLTSSTSQRAIFENPEHDFPKKIEYRLDGKKLIAAISGGGPGPAWAFERVGEVK